MKANYHTHTARCGHATGTDEDYVLAAIEQWHHKDLRWSLTSVVSYQGSPMGKVALDKETKDAVALPKMDAHSPMPALCMAVYPQYVAALILIGPGYSGRSCGLCDHHGI